MKNKKTHYFTILIILSINYLVSMELVIIDNMDTDDEMDRVIDEENFFRKQLSVSLKEDVVLSNGCIDFLANQSFLTIQQYPLNSRFLKKQLIQYLENTGDNDLIAHFMPITNYIPHNNIATITILINKLKDLSISDFCKMKRFSFSLSNTIYTHRKFSLLNIEYYSALWLLLDPYPRAKNIKIEKNVIHNLALQLSNLSIEEIMSAVQLSKRLSQYLINHINTNNTKLLLLIETDTLKNKKFEVKKHLFLRLFYILLEIISLKFIKISPYKSTINLFILEKEIKESKVSNLEKLYMLLKLKRIGNIINDNDTKFSNKLEDTISNIILTLQEREESIDERLISYIRRDEYRQAKLFSTFLEKCNIKNTETNKRIFKNMLKEKNSITLTKIVECLR